MNMNNNQQYDDDFTCKYCHYMICIVCYLKCILEKECKHRNKLI